VSLIAAQADRRFRRAHVKPARKRGRVASLVGPALKYGVLAAVAAYALYRGGGVVAHARLLQIDRIVVRGNGRLSSGEVLAVLTGLRGENIVWADLDLWRRRLMASPWVRDAALRRSLPSTVEVVVTEREPIAIGRINGELYLVDDRGVVIDQHGPQYADFDLPIVDGLAAPSDASGARVDEARAELAARLIASLRTEPDVAQHLSQIDVSDLHNAAVILNNDRAVIYVGRDRFLPRIRSYLQLATTLRERVPDIDYVDLRFDDRIYVRPAKKLRD
jgi:cell division protein FtsQ